MAKKITQKKLAQLTGLSQQRLSQLLHDGVWTRNDSLVAANKKIIKHLGDLKAGHKSAEGLDLIHERARLSNLQADKVSIDTQRSSLELQRMMAELMPLVFLTEILAFQNSNIRNRCLGIPNAVKVKHPETPTAIFLSLKEIVIQVLTDLSHVRFPAELDERIKRHFRDLLAATESNGDGVGG
jgi:phage terminase Nu1 subunit (DNA packaging protein)